MKISLFILCFFLSVNCFSQQQLVDAKYFIARDSIKLGGEWRGTWPTASALTFYKAYTTIPLLRADNFYANTGSLVAQITNGNSFFWSNSSTATDDSLFVVKPTAVSGAGRWVRLFTGVVKASEAGILSTGADQTTNLNKLYVNATVKQVLIDNGNVTITGTVNLQGKILQVNNKAKIGGVGGVITGGYIEASWEQNIFDTTISVLLCKNTWVSLKWFGALGDSVTNDTKACQKASQCINSMSGGTLFIPKGMYIVGLQTFPSTEATASYSNETMLQFLNCTKDIIIVGNGATFKVASRLHYGTFSRTTGLVVIHGQPYYNASNDIAQIGDVFDFNGNAKVVINDVFEDGNLTNLVIGGGYGDTGWQLESDGFHFLNNTNVYCNNLISNYNALDGFLAQTVVLTADAVKKPHSFLNCQSMGNGRQGISFTGGNNLLLQNCKFNNTGKTANASIPVGYALSTLFTSPGAGIDDEAEAGNLTINAVAQDCEFINNTGPGVLLYDGSSNVLGMDFFHCKFIGTTAFATWIRRPNCHFNNNCLIVGSINGAWNASSAEDPTRTIFNNTQFSFDTTLSPTGVVYGTYIDFGGSGAFCEFNDCIFNGGQHGVSPFLLASSKEQIKNCTFYVSSSTTSYTRGLFYGVNRFSGGVNDFTGSEFRGQLYINDSLYSQVAVFMEGVNVNSPNFYRSSQQLNKIRYGNDPTLNNTIPNAIYGDIILVNEPEINGIVGHMKNTAGNWQPFGVLGDSVSVNTKQNILVSGTNIKTINSTSLLGSGNITITPGTDSSIRQGNGISIGISTTNRTIKVDTSVISTFYQNSLKANIASPTFTGVPAAPTASPGTNTTQIATTAFVVANQSGTGADYTATLTGVSNVTGLSLISSNYVLNGDIVTISGAFSVTTTAAVSSEVGISLNGYCVGTNNTLHGVVSFNSALGTNAYVIGDSGNNRAALKFTALAISGSGIVYFTFSFNKNLC